MVGKQQALIISNLLKTKFREYSHQEGHIAAGVMNRNLALCKNFEFSYFWWNKRIAINK